MSARIGIVLEEPIVDSDNSFEFSIGSLRQGEGSVGERRDKEVSHNHVDGSLSYYTTTPFTDLGEAGLLVSGRLISSGSQSSYVCDEVGTLGVTSTGSVTYKPNPIREGSTLYNYFLEEPPQISLTYVGDYIWARHFQPGYRKETLNGVLVSTQEGSWTDSFTKAEVRNNQLYTGTSKPTLEEAMLISATLPAAGLYRLAFSSRPPISQDEIMPIIRSMTSQTLLQDLNEQFDYGELSVDIARAQKYVTNNILLLIQDILRLRGTAVSIADLFDLKTLRNAMYDLRTLKGSHRAAKSIAKKLSDAILVPKYAIAPNIRDFKDLGNGVWKYINSDSQRNSRLHSRKTVTLPSSQTQIDVDCVLTAIVSNNATREMPISMGLIKTAKMWGMYPELENLWDIIPFSFVVDWFVQYGDLFETMDNYMYLENYFPVLYTIASAKATRSYDVSSQLRYVTGSVLKTEYERHISVGSIPLPKMHLTASTSLNKHWVEAGALVAQRL